MSETKPNSQTPAKEKKPRGNPILALVKAGKPLPPGYYLDAKNRVRKVEEVPEVVEGEFDRLKAMRFVLNNPPSLDKTEGAKACRAWLSKSPGAFMETYDELEKAARGSAGPEQEKPVEETETDEEVRTAIHELLARYSRKSPS